MTSDLPASFDTAETEFSRFLSTHGYPSEIIWTSIADVLVNESRHYFIRLNIEASRSASKNRYLTGIGRGLGVELRAICVSEKQTFACVDIPMDATDAQYRMIGPGLKMSCPVEPSRGLWCQISFDGGF